MILLSRLVCTPNWIETKANGKGRRLGKMSKIAVWSQCSRSFNFYWGHSLWSKCLKLWYKKRQWMFFQKILLLLFCSKPSLRKSLIESDNSGWWPCTSSSVFVTGFSDATVPERTYLTLKLLQTHILFSFFC